MGHGQYFGFLVNGLQSGFVLRVILDETASDDTHRVGLADGAGNIVNLTFPVNRPDVSIDGVFADAHFYGIILPAYFFKIYLLLCTKLSMFQGICEL